MTRRNLSAAAIVLLVLALAAPGLADTGYSNTFTVDLRSGGDTARVLAALDGLDAAVAARINADEENLADALAYTFLVADGKAGGEAIQDAVGAGGTAEGAMSAALDVIFTGSAGGAAELGAGLISDFMVSRAVSRAGAQQWEFFRNILSVFGDLSGTRDFSTVRNEIRSRLAQGVLYNGTRLSFDEARDSAHETIQNLKSWIQSNPPGAAFPDADLAVLIGIATQSLRDSTGKEAPFEFFQPESFSYEMSLSGNSAAYRDLAKELYLTDRHEQTVKYWRTVGLGVAGLAKGAFAIATFVPTAGQSVTGAVIAEHALAASLAMAATFSNVSYEYANLENNRVAALMTLEAIDATLSELSAIDGEFQYRATNAPPLVEAVDALVRGYAAGTYGTLDGYGLSVQSFTLPALVYSGSNGLAATTGTITLKNTGSRAAAPTQLLTVASWTGGHYDKVSVGTLQNPVTLQPGQSKTFNWSCDAMAFSVVPSTVQLALGFGPMLMRVGYGAEDVTQFLVVPEGAGDVGDNISVVPVGSGTASGTSQFTNQPSTGTQYVTYTLSFAFGDLDLHVYDNAGRHQGMNYTTGTVENGIPGASGPDPEGNPEAIRLPVTPGVTYRIEVVDRTSVDEGQGTVRALRALSTSRTSLASSASNQFNVTALEEGDIGAVLAVGPPSQTISYDGTSTEALGTFTVAEIGGQDGITGLSARASDLHGGTGETISAGELGLDFDDVSLAPGASTVLTLSVPMAGHNDFPYTGTVTITSSAGQRTVQVTIARPPGNAPPLDDAGRNIYLIPASAHASGLAGTSWVSDVVLYNEGSSTASVNLYYLEGNHDHSGVSGKRISVPAGTSVKLGDVVGSTFGGSSSSGALYVGSDQPLLITSRTYNNASSGTYGQFIAGMPLGDAVGTNQTVRLIQLTRDSSYRTNIGFANASDRTITVQVKLYRSNGSYIATRSYTIQPYGFYQKTDIIGTDVSDAYALISSSTAGAKFFTYASVIDNRTGDPVFITPGAGTASAGQSLYIPGSAHVNGTGGTQWRTDLEIHNPGNTTATYRIELLKRDRANTSPEARTYNLSAGHSVRYTDALGALFWFTGAGALRITPSSGTVMVTSRTYNQTSEGTYGQFIAAVPANRAIAQGDSVPLVQLADSASTSSGYRTNIGFVNTTNKTISVKADLYNGSGSKLGTKAITLGAYEYKQIDKIFRSVTSSTLDNCYAVLSTTTSGGSFLAYASVVDNRSGDPVYVPATGSGGGGGGTCTIRVTSPNGGEIWNMGTTHTVRWTKSGSGCGSKIKAELRRNGQLASTSRTGTPNDGSLTWNIPTSLTQSGKYRVRLTDLGGTGASDTSDGNFTLMAAGQNENEITITLPGGVTMELVHIPAGTFMMGSPTSERGRDSDEDLHQVTLTHGYYIGKYEVTQAQWQAVMGSNPSYFSSCGGDCPVEQVSWNDICGGTTGSDCTSSSFIGKLNAYLGTTKFRLPTEAEWERAARAGTQTEFSFSVPSDWDTECGSFPEAEAHMWWCGNSNSQTHRVGSKQPNGYGLYDMHGNVWEWVADGYTGHLGTSAVTDPTVPPSGWGRVRRGACWINYSRQCRSAVRTNLAPSNRADYLGFRLARSE